MRGESEEQEEESPGEYKKTREREIDICSLGSFALSRQVEAC